MSRLKVLALLVGLTVVATACDEQAIAKLASATDTGAQTFSATQSGSSREGRSGRSEAESALALPEIHGTVVSVDRAAGQLVLSTPGGATITLKMSPSTIIDVQGPGDDPAALKVGALVEVTHDPASMQAARVEVKLATSGAEGMDGSGKGNLQGKPEHGPETEVESSGDRHRGSDSSGAVDSSSGGGRLKLRRVVRL